MALQIPNYLPNVNPFQDIVSGINAAQAIQRASLANKAAQIQNQYLNPTLQAQLQQQNLANTSAAIRNKYLPQILQSQIQNSQTNADKLSYLQSRFGPQYQFTKLVNTPLGQQLVAQNSGIATNMANYLGQQSAQMLPPVDANGNPVAQAAAPAITPQQVAAAQNATAQKLLKSNTDTSARNRSLFAANIDKTLAQIDPDTLTQYAGIKGQLQLAKDKAAAALGNTSPAYQKYLNNVIAAKMLATQVRQFYGDSIQPAMLARLEQITQPGSWMTNPKAATEQFNKFANILNKETATYRSALQAPGIYYGVEQGGAAPATSAAAAPPSGPQLPTFKNQQEMNSWLQTASAPELKAYLAKYGKGGS